MNFATLQSKRFPTLEKWAPWAVVAAVVVGLVVVTRPPAMRDGFDLDGFGRVAILEGGRVKPIDSLARNSLLMINGKQSVILRDDAGKFVRFVPATEWLADALFRPEVADKYPAFYIDDEDVLGVLGLTHNKDRAAYSFAQILPRIQEVERQGEMAHAVDSKQRSRFQSAIANLYERVLTYYRLKNSVQLEGAPGLAMEVGAVADPSAAPRQQRLASMATFRVVPPAPGKPETAWRNTGEALGDAAAGQQSPGLAPLARMSAAYAGRDAATFNAAVAELRAVGAKASPTATGQADHEIIFNRVEPFYLGMVLYVLAMILVFVSWLVQPRLLQGVATALLASGAVIHTLGLLSRIILQGRPPVTNLYSSAVFVGWGAVIVGLLMERMYRRGWGTATAAAAGFASLIVAHHLTGDGDTMEMMRAVLDSNFWLGTHVVTITIGYSGVFLAGAIAIAYTLRKHFAPTLDEGVTKSLVGMTYGVVSFALFFSFVGTVLGGIWADQSWGRFWGWDPKENGALLIVLWNAIILHARWAGLVRDRGIMTMAIFGNVICAFSWFGVNMLGVGLHSYGFMDKAFYSLAAFCASQVALMALCLAPRKFWRGGTAGSGTAAAHGKA